MSDKELIAEARRWWSKNPRLDTNGRIGLDLADALEAVTRERAAVPDAATEAQVEAAAKAIEKIPHIVWNSPTRQDAMTLARAALEAAARAAQGAAPRIVVCDYCGDALPSAQSRAHIPTTPSIQRLGFSADKVVCPECVQRARCAAPVLPSSGVDEDALAEVVRKSENAWQKATGPTTRHEWIARAVAEWLKGQGNAARE